MSRTVPRPSVSIPPHTKHGLLAGNRRYLVGRFKLSSHPEGGSLGAELVSSHHTQVQHAVDSSRFDWANPSEALSRGLLVGEGPCCLTKDKTIRILTGVIGVEEPCAIWATSPRSRGPLVSDPECGALKKDCHESHRRPSRAEGAMHVCLS